MFQEYKLKKQFTCTFIVVLVCSFLSLLILGEVAFFLLIKKDVLHKANYYEQNSNKVEEYMQKKGMEVLKPEFKYNLEKSTPVNDIEYEVINSSGDILYGNIKEKIIVDKKELLNKINTFENSNDLITRYGPIIGEQGGLQGLVIFRYPIKVTTVSNSPLTYSILVVTFFVTPFIFIIFYSFIFGSKFAKSVNKPLNLLVEASNNIRNNNLDFEMNYTYDNELGNVIKSFNAMKYELKNTLNKKWQLEQERKDMISALSHDLKTPLTIIKGHVEMLQEGAAKKPERLERYLGIIGNNTNRAISLVEDLNTLSKIERPDFKLYPITLDLDSFIEDKKSEYISFCKDKNIHLIINKENTEGFKGSIDSLRISQVIDNLFLNSLRFTPENGEIEINISYLEDKISFSISDSGKGFNKEELNNIFNKFYQGDKSRSEEKGHSGLGLYICKLLVEKHGGEIIASNNSNGGALINFYIKVLSI